MQDSGFSLGGFQNPAFEATDVFRKVLGAMARPGQIETVAADCGCPDSLNAATAASLLTLTDMETGVWLAPAQDSQQARDFLTFHAGCCLVDGVGQADFVVASPETPLSVLDNLSLGDVAFPERSATVILAVTQMTAGRGVTLSGPGIEKTCDLFVAGLGADFWAWRAQKCALFPCGFDLILTSGDRVAAIPRTSFVEV